VYPAPVHDAISARIAEMLGFDLAFTAGSVSAATELCVPADTMLLTATELAQQVRRMSRASDLSLMVVAEDGYGNALNVMRSVEALEDAGAAAIVLEDTAPSAFGTGEMDRMVSIDEAVGKLRAALATRRDSSLVIVGRTVALKLPAGIPEALRRVREFEGVGVDAIFLSGHTTSEAIEAVHSVTSLPLMVSRQSVQLEDPGFLEANGVRVASAGHLSLWASVQAVHDALKALRAGKTQSELRPSVASPELMADVTRQAQYAGWIDAYLN
jgi:carboxyvinyl-carboxyphosphonate phosphorylmutase